MELCPYAKLTLHYLRRTTLGEGRGWPTNGQPEVVKNWWCRTSGRERIWALTGAALQQ